MIPLLIPLALQGRALPADRRQRAAAAQPLIYGLGGLIAPFIGIKLIDLVVHNLLGA